MNAAARRPQRYVLAIVPHLRSTKSTVRNSGEVRDHKLLTRTGQMLVRDIFTSTFCVDTWTKQHSYCRGIAGQFDDLVSIDSIEKILANCSPDTSRVQLALEGTYIDPRELCDPSTLDRGARPRCFNADKVELLLSKGATLIINAIDEIHEQTGDLAEDVEHLTGIPVQVNLYATWGSLPGFNVHWDEHEVLVLQVKGKKEWRLYGKTTDHPVRILGDLPRPTILPVDVFSLSDGDLLYIPRGHWHSVHPYNELSIHLTIGLHTSTGLDLLAWIQNHLSLNSFFRSDIPQLQPSSSDFDEYAKHFIASLEEVVTTDCVAAFAKSRQRGFKRRKRVDLGHLRSVTPVLIERNTEFHLVPDNSTFSIYESDDLAALSDGTRYIVLSKMVMPAIRHLMQSRSCTLGSLCDTLLAETPVSDVRDMLLELYEVGLVSLC